MSSSFEVTWDYLCPFARNAHEHLAVGLQAGADWDVHFRFFSLSQAHHSDDEVWASPADYSGVLAGLTGIVLQGEATRPLPGRSCRSISGTSRPEPRPA